MGSNGTGGCDQLRLTPSAGALHRSGGRPWRAGSAGPGGKSCQLSGRGVLPGD